MSEPQFSERAREALRRYGKTEEKTTRWVVVEYSGWNNAPTGYRKVFNTFEEAEQFYQRAKRGRWAVGFQAPYFGYPTEEKSA